MISVTKLSRDRVAILLIIVINQKKDKSGRIIRNPFIKIILRENFWRQKKFPPKNTLDGLNS